MIKRGRLYCFLLMRWNSIRVHMLKQLVLSIIKRWIYCKIEGHLRSKNRAGKKSWRREDMSTHKRNSLIFYWRHRPSSLKNIEEKMKESFLLTLHALFTTLFTHFKQRLLTSLKIWRITRRNLMQKNLRMRLLRALERIINLL